MSEAFNAAIILTAIDQTRQVFDDVGGAGLKLGKVLAGIGTAAVVGGVAVVGAMAGTISKTTEWANRLDGLGDVLGTTGTESAGLIVAIEGVGGSADMITSQMARLSAGIESAGGKAGPSAIAMQGLGISFKGSNGELLSSTQIIQNVADKIAAMPDGLAKTTAMTDLFGKSGKDMSDVMNALANGGLANATQSAKDMGLALSDDAINGSIKMGRDMEKLKQTLEGVAVSIGAKLLPIVGPMVTKFADFASTLVANLIPALTPVAEVLGRVGEALGVVGGKIMEFFTQLSSGEDTIDVIYYALEDLFGEGVATAITGFITMVVDAWPQIVSTATTAFNIIKTVVSDAIAIVSTVIGGIVTFITTNWDTIKAIVEGIFLVVSTVITGAIDTAKIAIASLTSAWTIVSAALAPIMATIGKALGDAFAALGPFIEVAGPAVAKVFEVIKTAVGNLLTAFGGKSFASAIGIDPETVALISGIVGELAKPFIKFGEWMASNWPLIKKVFGEVMTAIMPIVDKVLPPLKTIFATTFGIISDNIGSAVKIILGLVKGMLQIMNGDVLGGVQTIADSFKNKFTKIGEFIASIKDEIVKIGQGIIDGLYNAIVGGGKKVWDAIVNIVMGPINDLKNKLGLGGLFGGGDKSGSNYTGSSVETGFANSVGMGGASGQTLIIQMMVDGTKMAEAVLTGKAGASLLFADSRRGF